MFLRKTIATLALIFSLFLGASWSQQKTGIPRPVDSNRSYGTSNFEADYERVWHGLFKILSDRGFAFFTKDKNLGRIETGFVIFSHNPYFSQFSHGVKSLGKPPRVFLRKWVDGRIKIFAEVRRLAQNSTQVILRPDIYGFASTLSDDSGVSGEWRQCVSNGKFEFELFNELATILRKEGAVNPSEVTKVPVQVETPRIGAGNPTDDTTVVFTSVPEGAEILLNGRLVGMTPSRLTVAAGAHKVVFRRKGYKDYERDFLIFRESDLTISAEMEERQ